MIRLFILCLVLVSSTFAQKVLHVSTIPSHADIYVGEIHPDHADKPDFTTPAFIPITEGTSLDGEILISLFSPSFSDTTIKVKLSDRDTSYLIVSQRPVLDERIIQDQQGQVSKRTRRFVGQKMMLFSIAPILVGAASSAVAYYEISQADKAKKKLENSAIVQSQHYTDTENEFKDSRNKAKYAKYTAYTGLALGASLLSIGFILSF